MGVPPGVTIQRLSRTTLSPSTHKRTMDPALEGAGLRTTLPGPCVALNKLTVYWISDILAPTFLVNDQKHNYILYEVKQPTCTWFMLIPQLAWSMEARELGLSISNQLLCGLFSLSLLTRPGLPLFHHVLSISYWAAPLYVRESTLPDLKNDPENSYFVWGHEWTFQRLPSIKSNMTKPSHKE